MPRPWPKSRVVGFEMQGPFDIERAMTILARARRHGTINEFDGTHSSDPNLHAVWFNGRPGRALRRVCSDVYACAPDLNLIRFTITC